MNTTSQKVKADFKKYRIEDSRTFLVTPHPDVGTLVVDQASLARFVRELVYDSLDQLEETMITVRRSFKEWADGLEEPSGALSADPATLRDSVYELAQLQFEEFVDSIGYECVPDGLSYKWRKVKGGRHAAH